MVTALLTSCGFRPSSVRRRILGEGAWAAAGQVTAALGTLVGLRLLTEVVPPSIFGTVSLLLGLSMLGTNLFCAPFMHAASRYYPDLAREGKLAQLRRHLEQQLSRTTLVLIVLVLLGGAIAAWFGGGSFWPFPALAALLAVEVQRTTELNLLNAARRHRPYALWIAIDAWAKPLLAALL